MFESKINRGKANGYAPLGSTGKVPLENLPPIQSTLDTGSFATIGSNTFTGVQTLAGTSGEGGAAVLTIGQLSISGPGSFDINATASGSGFLGITSDYVTAIGAISGSYFSPNAKNVIFATDVTGFPINDGNGPIALLAMQNENIVREWLYNYDGKSYMPGELNIGYYDFGQEATSGSLNIRHGNINVSGSIFVSGNIYANNLTGSKFYTGSFATTGSNQFNGDQSISGSLTVSSTYVNTSVIGALNSDLVIDNGNIILSGSFAQQVNYAPIGSGSFSNPFTDTTQLDITKDIHLIDITDNVDASNFYLPNGLYDGQVVRFALKGNSVAGSNSVWIWMNNLRTYDGSIQSYTTWSPFWDNGGSGYDNPRSLATAVYIDGAWNIDSDWWGM